MTGWGTETQHWRLTVSPIPSPGHCRPALSSHISKAPGSNSPPFCQNWAWSAQVGDSSHLGLLRQGSS